MYDDKTINPQSSPDQRPNEIPYYERRYEILVTEQFRQYYGPGNFRQWSHDINDMSELPRIENEDQRTNIFNREVSVLDKDNHGELVKSTFLEYRDNETTPWRRVDRTYNEDGTVDVKETYRDENGQLVEKTENVEQPRVFSDDHFKTEEVLRGDGSVFRVTETIFTDNGKEHKLDTYFDEKGIITKINLNDLTYSIDARSTRREDGTLESRTVTLYRGLYSDNEFEVKIVYKYSEDGNHVESSERTDRFKEIEHFKAFVTDIVVTNTEYDKEGHIEFICCDDSPDISVEDTRQDVDTDTSDFSDQSPDVDDESDDSTDDVDDDREE